MHGLLSLTGKLGYRPRGKIFNVCHGPHLHDSIYAEDLLEFFRGAGPTGDAMRLLLQNLQRELLRCLNELKDSELVRLPSLAL
jgi:hypothetical protein